MRFYTNRIPTSSSGDFAKLVEKVAGNKKQVKTASAEEEVKTAEVTEAANSDNETREGKHWVEGSPGDGNGVAEKDGQSLTVDPAGLDSGKETMCEAQETQIKEASPKNEEEEEEVVESSDDSMNKEAGCGCCDNCGGDGCACDGCKVGCAASNEGETKVADAPAIGDGAGDGDDQEGITEGRFPDEFTPDGSETEASSGKTEVKEASKSQEFIKIANLNGKTKNWLKTYWKMVYPSDYADAMVQDK